MKQRRRAWELAEKIRWREWLVLAGNPEGWRRFQERFPGEERERLVRITKEELPILVMTKGAAGAYHSAAVIRARINEGRGRAGAQPTIFRANGAFMRSQVLALEWAKNTHGMSPSGLDLNVDGLGRIPAPPRRGPTLVDESAGLAFLMGAQWHLQGLRPSRPVAFTGRLDEISRKVLPVGGVEDKAAAARRAGVAWVVTAGPMGSSINPDSARRIVRIPSAHWLDWVPKAEEMLRRRCRVSLEPALEVWHGWLHHLDALTARRNVGRANAMASELYRRSLGVPARRGIRGWDEVLFRIHWELARVKTHGGQPRQAESLYEKAGRLLHQYGVRLDATQRVRIDANRLLNAVDLGWRRPPDMGSLLRLRRSRFNEAVGDEPRIKALGAVADWLAFQSCHPRALGRRDLLEEAEGLLKEKLPLELAALRATGGHLVRTHGQLASLFSLGGRWDEVPATLGRLIRVPTRALAGEVVGDDVTNWRFQAFYAARWLAFARLTGRGVPDEWWRWWAKISKRLHQDVDENDEAHVRAGLERSLVILDGRDRWDAEREKDLEEFFSRLTKRAATFEHDNLIAWGFAEALAWLASRWRLPWGATWSGHAGASLDRLGWYGRYADLMRLHRRLARMDPSADSDAAGFQAILRCVLY